MVKLLRHELPIKQNNPTNEWWISSNVKCGPKLFIHFQLQIKQKGLTSYTINESIMSFSLFCINVTKRYNSFSATCHQLNSTLIINYPKRISFFFFLSKVNNQWPRLNHEVGDGQMIHEGRAMKTRRTKDGFFFFWKIKMVTS